MVEIKCSVLNCGTTLSSKEEVATGICDSHINLLLKRHSYGVVCWQCGMPTHIDDKPTEKSKPIIKDKYIMSKSCPQCEAKSDGHRYMTIRSGELSKVVLSEGHTLYPGPDGLVSSKRNKTYQSSKLRGTSETERPKADFFKIRLEADKRALDFLATLEFEDQHGE